MAGTLGYDSFAISGPTAAELYNCSTISGRFPGILLAYVICFCGPSKRGAAADGDSGDQLNEDTIRPL